MKTHLPSHPKVDKQSRILIVCLLFILLASVTTIIVLGSVPPVSRDALTQHLSVPKLYLQHGGIYEIPSMVVSYYPMNLDLLYLIPLALGNDIIPKYIHFLFALLTAWIIFKYLRFRLNTTFGLLGSLFFLTIPIIVKLSTTVYVDLGLIFFSTQSLLFLFQWQENKKVQSLVFAGICCGLAIGTKYNGIISLLILFFITIFTHLHISRKACPIKSLLYGCLFIGIAILVFSPWMIRNYHWTGNPIYPLFNQLLTSTPHESSLNIPPILQRKLIFHENWWQILFTPIRIFFLGRDGNPQFFDGVLTPFLLFLPLCCFFIPSPIQRNSESFQKKILLIYSIFIILFVFFRTGMRIRYISPAIPPLVILSMFGLKDISDISHKYISHSFRFYLLIPIVVIVSAFFYNYSYMMYQYRTIQPLKYLSGSESRIHFITRFNPEYPLIKWANEHLPPNAKILAISLGNRSYYFNRDVQFDLQNLKSTICELVRKNQSDIEIKRDLKKLGITHLMLRYDIFWQWVQDHLDANQQRRLESFFRTQTKKIAEINNHGLFVLNN